MSMRLRRLRSRNPLQSLGRGGEGFSCLFIDNVVYSLGCVAMSTNKKRVIKTFLTSVCVPGSSDRS